MSRNYHNLVSHYNIYFNGNESYKKGVNRINDQFRDDYSQLLPIFKYGDESLASSVSGEMDRAIEKASKVIGLHSITAKPEIKENREMTDRDKEFYERSEYNDWVDDSYLLMGKAQTLKHEYLSANKTYNYVIKETADDVLKQEAMIWLAYVLSCQEEDAGAGEILALLQEEQETDKKLLSFYYAVYANHYIQMEDHEQAVQMLENSLEHEKDKQNSYRYTYILAQLYAQTGRDMDAYNAYARVVRMNPPYDMTFNARIRQAESFDVNSGNVDELKKILRKMLRDEKNVEYQDQIYYAYGQIALKEGKKQEAIDYYKLSAASSVQNNKQKGISYLTIADLYFEDEDYVPSQAYYDSAIMSIDKDFPNYEALSVKSSNLNLLVKNINVIEREDSLQMVADMPEAKRSAFINNLIQELREEERRQLEAERNPFNQSDIYEGQRRVNQQLNQTGKWYFNNPGIVDFGRNEFRKKWGNRKLEDNWRRKDKSVVEMSIAGMTEDEEGSIEGEGKAGEKEKYTQEYYLKDLPLTEEERIASDSRIETAMYNKSGVYMNELKDYPRAIGSYEELIKRFPGSSYMLSSYYHLYELNNREGKTARANYYKGLILKEFPESEYAQLLSDPDYLRKRNEKEQAVYRNYEELYALFLSKDYTRVIAGCDQAVIKYADHELMSKFYLLRAYAVGGLGNVNAFKEALELVVDKSPAGEEEDRALELIAHFNESVPELKLKEEQEEAKDVYKSFGADEEQLLVIAVLEGRPDMNQLKFDIINFNYDNYPQEKLNVVTQTLESGLKIVKISGAGALEKAMAYYELLKKEEIVLAALKESTYSIFLFNETNYQIFTDHLKVGVYEKFFNSNYLSGKKR